MIFRIVGRSWFIGGAMLVVVLVVLSSLFMTVLAKKRYTITECNEDRTYCTSWIEWR